MLRHDDWMTYSYNDIIKGPKTSKTEKLRLHIKRNIEIKPISYIDALYRNASLIQDTFNQTQDVLLSGGTDSEIIVRINHDLKIKQNLYTFRLEDNLNYKDVEASKKLCNELNLKLNIIDFNAKKFVENKAESIYKKTFMALPYMIRVAWFDYLDNLPVLGLAEQYWMRVLGSDYSKKSEWHHTWYEGEFDLGIYGHLIDRPIIGEWYLYTPEPLMTYHKNDVIKSIINDESYGKTSTWSSRHLVFKHIWPNIEFKQKLTGYEGDNVPGSRPEYITEFEEKVMGGFKHRYINIYQKELESIFAGQGEFVL